MESETRKGPIAKGQKGRFQVATWKKMKKVEAENSFDVERDVETVRASVQYGRFNREDKTWENDVIWCNPSELGHLAEALEGLRDQQNGMESAPNGDPESGREET